LPTSHDDYPSTIVERREQDRRGRGDRAAASVVKELLENAVTQGNADDVRLEKAASDVIRIADNGCGIIVDELRLPWRVMRPARSLRR